MVRTGSVTVKIDDADLKKRIHGLLADAWEQGFVRAATLLTEDVAAGNHRDRNPYLHAFGECDVKGCVFPAIVGLTWCERHRPQV